MFVIDLSQLNLTISIDYILLTKASFYDLSISKILIYCCFNGY